MSSIFGKAGLTSCERLLRSARSEPLRDLGEEIHSGRVVPRQPTIGQGKDIRELFGSQIVDDPQPLSFRIARVVGKGPNACPAEQHVLVLEIERWQQVVRLADEKCDLLARGKDVVEIALIGRLGRSEIVKAAPWYAIKGFPVPI